MNRIPVILMGAGGVGRALIEQIVKSRETVATRGNCRFDVVALVDSRSWSWNAAGHDDEALLELVAAKKEERRRSTSRRIRSRPGAPTLGEESPDGETVVQRTIDEGLEGSVLVDVTASDEMAPVVDSAVQAGYGVVLANKIPLAAPWPEAQHLFGRPQVRYEATVGGGQPVIATLRYLLDSGDCLRQAQGQLSGTLAYIMQRLDDGTRFSVALAAAHARGLTEPDPRRDLSGEDVQRKLLILGRTVGWPLEAEDIAVESLVPSSLAHLGVQEFMLASLAMDPSLRDRVNAAGAAGEVLRYVGEVRPDGGQVGLKALPVDAAQANLKYVSFDTERYDEQPLLVGSNSGGVQTTAAAVLGDMIGLVREWGSW
ncbi:MAG TPA: hypothetical protein VE553_06400 [Candidatus Binatia bacterium]|jgi:homoserine dehydrogenase|nr:hypothetical protein [Candidatus Binatia bacterium]